MSQPNAVQAYLSKTSPADVNTKFLGYLCQLTEVAKVQPHIAASIVRELADERRNLKMIASENFSSISTQFSMGNLLTDKYAEGFPHHRFYAGCSNVDDIESLAADAACKLFGAEHAFVQPHSGSDANLIAYLSLLAHRVQTPFLRDLARKKQGPDVPESALKLPQLSHLTEADWTELRRLTGSQRLLALDYYSGGHISHGYRMNVSALLFESHTYTVDRATMLLDYDAIEAQAVALKPAVLLVGYSAYSRSIDFRRMRAIADRVGALLMVDMAHFAGLVAGGVFTGDYNPVPFADLCTSTTHKTLRGPRGGLILCKQALAEAVDKACPVAMGGPIPQILAAKAVAFTEALQPEFRLYARRVVENCQVLAQELIKRKVDVLTGGTDNHLLLINVTPFGINGRQAEEALRKCGITLNRNALPFDPEGPWFTSGVRLGTPALTTLGMGPAEMVEVADIIHEVLAHTHASPIVPKDPATPPPSSPKLSRVQFFMDPGSYEAAKARIDALLSRFVLYPDLDLQFLTESFVDTCPPKQ